MLVMDMLIKKPKGSQAPFVLAVIGNFFYEKVKVIAYILLQSIHIYIYHEVNTASKKLRV